MKNQLIKLEIDMMLEFLDFVLDEDEKEYFQISQARLDTKEEQ